MIERLPPLQRRVLAPWSWCVLVLGRAAACGCRWPTCSAQEAALASGRRRVAGLQARVPGREELLARARQLRESSDIGHALLAGSTPAVAAAQLQGDLAGLAAATGGEITTVQILEAEEVPPSVRIGLRLGLSGGTATVRDSSTPWRCGSRC